MKAFLSFFTVLVSSAYFGASFERDVWVLSVVIMAIIGGIFFGPIIQIFRVKFIHLKDKEGESHALSSIGSLLSYMFLIGISLILMVELIPEIVTKLFATTYSDSQKDFFITVLRIVCPTLIFFIITSVLSGLLNIYNVFYIPETMSILTSLINVSMILLFGGTYGIYALIWANYISSGILVVVLFYFIYRTGIPIFKHLNLRFKYAYDYLSMSLPFYFTYFISQVLTGMENALSSFLGVGNVSVLDYSRKFVTIPNSMIQSTTNIVLAPSMAKIHVNEGEKSFTLELSKFIDLFLLICLPVITVFVICPEQVVRVFLVRGAFDTKYIEPTTQALFWFGLGIISIIFYQPVTQALVAQGKVKITAIVTSLMGFLILGLNLLFFNKYGIQVLAFSWSVSHFTVAVFLYFMISFKYSKYLLIELARKLSFITAILILSYVVHKLITSVFLTETTNFNSIVLMVLVVLFSMISEIILIYLLRFKEKELITMYFNKYILKKAN